MFITNMMVNIKANAGLKFPGSIQLKHSDAAHPACHQIKRSENIKIEKFNKTHGPWRI